MIDLKSKKYFLFDMDGTLVDLENLNYTCFRDAVKRFTGNELAFAEYMHFMAGVGSKKGFRDYFASIGYTTTPVDIVVTSYRGQKDEELRKNFEAVVKVKEGVVEFLQKLQEKKMKMAVGTSTAKKFTTVILERAGLAKFFETIVAVEDVQNTKPAPDIFFEALKRIGGNVREAVIFEDSGNGVKSAENSGIDFYVVRNQGKNDAVVAQHDNVISSYNELISQL
ncbi:HAD-IA family hydrolase [bacterium]|nr:HAD-IA family hydrolase [bacterium]